jgi:hypothetical protein
MKISILLPHYRTGKMTAYTIHQLLKYKGKHEIKIIVIDNNVGDGSVEYLFPFMKDILYVAYPKGLLQSHGIAFDYVLENGLVETPYFITIESDSFPLHDNWLDYYEELINQDVDIAGSLMKLSGGTYIHGCGSLIKKSFWEEAKEICDKVPYTYFPNMSRKNNFDCHLMLHNSIVDKVLENPNDWFELASGYKGLSKEEMIARAVHYSPCKKPFHSGLGGLDEDVSGYGIRNIEQDSQHIILNEKSKKLINRVGYEPSQNLCYMAVALGKKVVVIPTETKWMPNREGQQQEYSIMENGFKHLWAISSYVERGSEGVEDIYQAKRKLPDELYETLPNHLKIKQ